ncbi:hypothetical protein F4813DRAFT_326381 [Daldinia decipiens]|uniref:uncharacterized protein n=1 Tax=Daldinia decipiens TaxID=326647 RepID=UPI0020C2337E|nr:uncharacterized protein F4813DRAFT_326381 [Daldinia decipiens]KAI1659844.1 hypothetical protein F4813DRAFT_326381 [Daldinia decipiens]
MLQQFCLVAPHARKYIHLRARLERVFFKNVSIGDLVYLVAVPLKSHQRRFTSPVYTSQHINMNNSLEGIFGLPCEIQLKIFAELDDDRDCIAFGLTCAYFWGLALPVLHDKWAANLGSWAGEKIVCVGDWVKAEDYPPGLFSDAEILFFDQPEIRSALGIYSLSASEPNPVTLYGFSSRVMGCKQVLGTIWKNARREILLMRCSMGLAKHSLGFNTAKKHDFNTATKHDLKNFEEHCFYPRDQPWILRNLTTKEFIRSEAVALKLEFIQGPRIKGIGFAHVILSRICWSSVSNDDIGDPTKFTRGVWAGHRFDITQLSRHIETTRGETWIDISSEVMDDMSRIWERKYGPDWRERIIESVLLRERYRARRPANDYLGPMIRNLSVASC